jgi:hypothetical protein
VDPQKYPYGDVERSITVIAYLSEGFEGGATVFPRVPTPGSAGRNLLKRVCMLDFWSKFAFVVCVSICIYVILQSRSLTSIYIYIYIYICHHNHSHSYTCTYIYTYIYTCVYICYNHNHSRIQVPNVNDPAWPQYGHLDQFCRQDSDALRAKPGMGGVVIFFDYKPDNSRCVSSVYM